MVVWEEGRRGGGGEEQRGRVYVDGVLFLPSSCYLRSLFGIFCLESFVWNLLFGVFCFA